MYRTLTPVEACPATVELTDQNVGQVVRYYIESVEGYAVITLLCLIIFRLA